VCRLEVDSDSDYNCASRWSFTKNQDRHDIFPDALISLAFCEERIAYTINYGGVKVTALCT